MFLGATEQTGAAGEALGWRAIHLALRDDDGRLVGLLPLCLRHHSFGDFSHDWHWAAAWRQVGLDYYPKLVTGVLFTPASGQRFHLKRVFILDMRVRGDPRVRSEVIERSDPNVPTGVVNI